MEKQYKRQEYRPKPFSNTQVLVLSNALEQQVMIYEAAGDSIKKGLEYLKTKLGIGRLVQRATSVKSYVHETPLADYISLISTYFFRKSASQKNREAKIRKERQAKKAEKERSMKNPGGNSRYAKKAGRGTEKFWEDARKAARWTPEPEPEPTRIYYPPRGRY